MDVNCNGFGNNGALPSVAPNVRILLVTTSLMSLSSLFEQYFYKVTGTESTDVALWLLQARKNYYNIVIVDLCMPEMKIYEFVDKLHCQRNNIPVILMVEDQTMAFARKALDYGDCYLLPKPLSHHNIATLWQHIYRVTGEMPTSLTDITGYADIEKYGNPSSGNCDGAARNQNRSSSKRQKLSNTEKENIERRKNHTGEDSNHSNAAEEDVGSNSKKSRMKWTPSLHEKFLQAINILGEKGAQPKTLLKTMNEPGLTLRHISSHLQKYINFRANIGEQTQVFPQRFVHVMPARGNVIPTTNQAIPESHYSSNGLQVPNQESTGDSGMGMHGIRYADNSAI